MDDDNFSYVFKTWAVVMENGQLTINDASYERCEDDPTYDFAIEMHKVINEVEQMRRLEHIEAAKAEAIRLGATIEFSQGGKHIHGIIAIDGKQRKIFLSKTTNSSSVCHIVKEDVRRKVKKMRE